MPMDCVSVDPQLIPICKKYFDNKIFLELELKADFYLFLLFKLLLLDFIIVR